MNLPKTLRYTFTACLMIAGLLPVLPASASTEISVEGGGWGHGVGMSQHGVKALAEQGRTAEQIISHFYQGVTFGQVGSGNLTGHAEPLFIGAAQRVTFTLFGAVNGSLRLCIGGDCTLTATPSQGVNWSFRTVGSQRCQYFLNGVAQRSPGPCRGSIEWTDQPNTRVVFPDLGRTYARGSVVFREAPGDTFHVTVKLPLEEYLYGLGEMPSSWHIEALKAQAISGRTYALWRAWTYRSLESNAQRMSDCGCHLHASTLDQKYIGWAKEAEGTNGHWGVRWRSAVDATAGKAAIHSASGGRAIQAYYFSSSGRSTENVEDVWNSNAVPYLKSVSDPGFTRWTEKFTPQQFATRLGFDKVHSASITGRYASGSPSGISVKGTSGGSLITKSYTSNQFRLALGLRSHYITRISGFLPISFSVFLPGDFNGDGTEEIAAYSPSDGSWWVFDYQSGGLVGTEWTRFSTKTGWAQHLVGDFNGDGKDDIASFHPSNGTWWVSRSTGSGFSTSMWANFSTAKGWGPQLVGDFNGDGRDDIANFHSSNGTWWVSRSTGSGFSTGLWANFSTASGWVSRVVGDFNGDGRDDVAQFHPSNGTWWVSRSTGSGFSTSLWADFFTAKGWGPQIVGDFNGDGRDDIANFHDSNGRWWVSRSTGASFATSLRSSVSPAKGWTGQLALDLNGDGKDQLVNWHAAGQVWAIR